MTSDGYIGGWREDLEDKLFLGSLDDESAFMALRGQYTEVTIDPREALKIENQGPQGACQGHAISSVCEWCYILATGEIDLQLSRAMGYYETQRIDGISGDRGSTISGGVKLAKNTGICEERHWPYPRRYSNRRPDDWDDVLNNAAQYRIERSHRLTSYDAVRTFLGSGQGGISIGIRWGSSMSREVVDTFKRGGGGHAIGLFSLSERKDANGAPYVWQMNSWGSRWGNDGWSEWSPHAMEQMFADRYTVAIGLSEMPGVQPREWTVDEWRQKLRVA